MNSDLASELLNRPIALSPEHAHRVTAAVEGKLSAPLAPSLMMRTARVQKIGAGIAVIPIHGILVSRGPWAGPDVTSYETLIAQFQAAASDHTIQHLVIDVDSPGGAAAGAFEAAAFLRTVRSEKNIVAVINNLGCSAAFAIASAANRVVTTPSGVSGSIGVVALHCDISRALKAAGINVSLVYAGAQKTAGSPYEPLSADARNDLQHDINFLMDLFVETVASGRSGFSPKAIRATEARTFTGRDAVSAGLADEVGTLDSVLAGLANVGGTAPSKQVAPALPGLQIAASASLPTHSLSSAQERERILAIITCDAAAGRKDTAEHFALRTMMPAADAIAALATVPTGRKTFDHGRGPLGLLCFNDEEWKRWVASR